MPGEVAVPSLISRWLLPNSSPGVPAQTTCPNTFSTLCATVFASGKKNLTANAPSDGFGKILKPSGVAIELFPGRSVGNVFVVGPGAFVTFFGTKQKAAVIVLGTGRVIRQTVPAHPLIGAGQPIFVG